MKILDKIIISPTPPSSKNVAWFDGKGIKIPNQGEWKSTGGSGGGSGIEIVESVDKLSADAPLGSVAVVVEESFIQKVSVLDLPQPDASIINKGTYTIDASSCPQVLSVSMIIPEGPINASTSFTENEMLYFASSEVDLMGTAYGVIVGILPVIENNQIVGLAGMCMDQSTKTQKQWSFFAIQNGIVEINQDAIDECNSYINGLYYIGALPYVMQNMSLSKEQLEVYDKVLKIEAGIPSKAHVYLKANSWEELYKKDFENAQRSLDKISNDTNKKADIISIRDIPYSNILNPNTYYKDTVNKYSNVLYKLTTPSDENKYSEYVIEVKCDSTPPSVVFTDENDQPIIIKWANNVAPTFEGGFTYIISIVNYLGVFSQFVND